MILAEMDAKMWWGKKKKEDSTSESCYVTVL